MKTRVQILRTDINRQVSVCAYEAALRRYNGPTPGPCWPAGLANEVQETLSPKEGKHRLRKTGDVGLQPAHA